jgi:hypothetical protein
MDSVDRAALYAWNRFTKSPVDTRIIAILYEIVVAIVQAVVLLRYDMNAPETIRSKAYYVTPFISHQPGPEMHDFCLVSLNYSGREIGSIGRVISDGICWCIIVMVLTLSNYIRGYWARSSCKAVLLVEPDDNGFYLHLYYGLVTKHFW